MGVVVEVVGVVVVQNKRAKDGRQFPYFIADRVAGSRIGYQHDGTRQRLGRRGERGETLCSNGMLAVGELQIRVCSGFGSGRGGEGEGVQKRTRRE